MSEKYNKKELLKKLTHWRDMCGLYAEDHDYDCDNCKEAFFATPCKQAYRQIKEMIEKKKSKKPQVSKKWVEKWYEAILMNSGAITDEFGVRRQIYLMLKEAGVEVVEKQ